MTDSATATGSASLSDDQSTSAAPSAALLELLSPDGYYSYLNVPKPAVPDELIEEELIKKNYRRLSLKHHPDRPTGDAETFRILNRAQTVLLHPKLRQQYDLLGLDLDDEATESAGPPDSAATNSSSDEGVEGSSNEGSSSSSGGGSDGVFTQMASVTLAGILQIMVRTAMMMVTSVFIVRYRLTLFPAVAFLCFVAYRVHSLGAQANSPSTQMDTLSPIMIGIGLVLMYRGSLDMSEDGGRKWSYSFWAGETLVMTMFSFNSIPTQKTPAMGLGIFGLALLLSFWLGGNIWKYLGIIALEALFAIMAALAFPVMEMVLEHVMNEKLRKIGEKVRAQTTLMKAYYESRQQTSSK